MSPNNPTTIYLGIDVAKHHLDLDAARTRGSARVDNKSAGHRRIIKALQALDRRQGPAQVILEATGGYEQPLVEALHAAQIPVSVVMPGRVRKYAEAAGRHAKTDQLDAAVLSAYGAAIQPPPTQPRSETERTLRALTRRRWQLQQMQTQELNRSHLETEALPAELRRAAAKLRTLFAKQIAEIEAALRRLEKTDAAYQEKVQALSAIDGVGRITAAATLAALPELGTLNRGEVGSLAGLAPKNRDSGQHLGRRFIRGGRTEARQALYMAAVTAARCNPILKPLYERLRASGKAAKVALTAVMRRLLIHMNSVLKALLAKTADSRPTEPAATPVAT